ncbi:hypothetical protein T11_13717 [Trichinella zimbabwensis]|uniref:Uncharacterized protein n=2 Tax=Trichinella zimbabwensis TaxID=268475 RepID=A0A0V1H7M5_9BILA|nr:hypothetical protein T11_13717 [Trichinella zimbabwensis]
MNELNILSLFQSVAQQLISKLSESENGCHLFERRDRMLLRTVKCKECALTLVWGGILCVIFALGYLLFRRIIKEIEKMNRKRTILVFHTVDNLLYKPAPSGYTAPLLGVDLSH